MYPYITHKQHSPAPSLKNVKQRSESLKEPLRSSWCTVVFVYISYVFVDVCIYIYIYRERELPIINTHKHTHCIFLYIIYIYICTIIQYSTHILIYTHGCTRVSRMGVRVCVSNVGKSSINETMVMFHRYVILLENILLIWNGWMDNRHHQAQLLTGHDLCRLGFVPIVGDTLKIVIQQTHDKNHANHLGFGIANRWCGWAT